MTAAGSILIRYRRFARGWLPVLLCAALSVQTGYGRQEVWRMRGDAAGLTVALNPLDPDVIYAEGIFGGIIISRDRGAHWTLWSSPGIAGIRQILVHPADTSIVLAAASSGGLRRTTDAGSSWTNVLPGFGIDGESITVYPAGPDTLYAGNFADGMVYRSTDRGATWEDRAISSDRLCALAVRSDDPDILCAGTGGGTISRSTDGGLSWTVVKAGTAGANFQEVPKIVFHPLAPLVGYATVYGSLDSTLDVWKTTDGGATWNRTALQKFPTWSIVVDPLDPDVVYAGSFTGFLSTVYRSTDGGGSWTPLTEGLPPTSYMWSLKIHPSEPSNVILAATLGVFAPLGIFRLQSPSAAITGVLVDSVGGDTLKNGLIVNLATGDEQAVGETDPVFSFGYYDGDSTADPLFRALSYPYTVHPYSVSFVPDSTIAVTIPMRPLPKALVSGIILDSATSDPVEGSARLDADRLTGDTTFTAGTDGSGQFVFDSLYVSEPGVNDYTLLGIETEIPFTPASVASPVVSGDTAFTFGVNPADLFIVSAFDSGDYLSYYEEAAAAAGLRTGHWVESRQGPAPMSRSAEFSRRVLVYYTGDLTDSVPTASFDSLEAAIASGARLLLMGQNLVEKNEGSHFISEVCRVGFDNNTILAYNSGVDGDILDTLTFFTTGPGIIDQTSRDVLQPLDPGTVPILDYGAHTGGTAAVRRDNVGDSSRIVVVGFGLEGVYLPAKRRDLLDRLVKYLDGSVVTAVEEGRQKPVPSVFRLYRNYPNPFNPVTTITVDVPVATRGRLTVTNILGQRVGTVFEGVFTPGRHRLMWDAGGLPSGVYLYTLSTPPFRETGRMLLLR